MLTTVSSNSWTGRKRVERRFRTACDDAHGDIEAIGAALAQRLIALEADDDLLHLLWRLEEIFRHCRRDQDLRSAQRLIAHIRSISDWVVLSYGAEIKEFASRHSEIAKSVGFMFWKPQNLVGIGQHHLEAQIDLLQQSGPNWLDPGFFSDAVAGYVEDGVIRDKSGLSKKQQEIILVAADRFALSRPG